MSESGGGAAAQRREKSFEASVAVRQRLQKCQLVLSRGALEALVRKGDASRRNSDLTKRRALFATSANVSPRPPLLS
jgi:hypothetical protein